jgi:hypothetical protein
LTFASPPALTRYLTPPPPLESMPTAQTALRRLRGRGLLCDEVRLGKTIEAGLVLKEYRVRRLKWSGHGR